MGPRGWNVVNPIAAGLGVVRLNANDSGQLVEQVQRALDFHLLRDKATVAVPLLMPLPVLSSSVHRPALTFTPPLTAQ